MGLKDDQWTDLEEVDSLWLENGTALAHQKAQAAPCNKRSQ